MLSAVVLAGVLAASGCGDPPVPNTGGPVDGNTANFITAPTAESDVQGFSELNIAFALPKSLRIAARSPEDHELRLASRPGLSTAVSGRMALVSREGKSQALTDAMSAIVEHWNTARRNENLNSGPETQPYIVENFHPPGDHNLTIVKMRMQVTKPLAAPPGSDPGEVHQAEVLAVGYFTVLQWIKPAAAERPEQTVQQPIIAVFILESAPATEAALDAMIKSIRGMEK